MQLVQIEYENRVSQFDDLLKQLKVQIERKVLHFKELIEDQNYPARNLENIKFNSQDLNETINLLLSLWNLIQKMNEELAIQKPNQSDINSIKLFDQNNEIPSSIIGNNQQQQIQKKEYLERDFNWDVLLNHQNNSSMQQQPDEKQNSFIIQEKAQNKNKVWEENAEPLENLIFEINREIDWFQSLLNQENNNINNRNYEALNQTDDQFYQESQLNQQNLRNLDQNSTTLQARNCKKLFTIEDVKDFITQYKKIVIFLQEIQKEQEHSKNEIQRLNKKISEFEQKEKNQQHLQQLQSQSNSIHDSVESVVIFQKKELDKQQQKKVNRDGAQSLESSISQNQQQNTQNVQKRQIHHPDDSILQYKKIAYDYKIFILMAILDCNFFPQKYNFLSKERIDQIWDQLKGHSRKYENEVVEILKYKQNSYFQENKSFEELQDKCQQGMIGANQILININSQLNNMLSDVQKDQKLRKRQDIGNKFDELLQYIEDTIQLNSEAAKKLINIMISKFQKEKKQ